MPKVMLGCQNHLLIVAIRCNVDWQCSTRNVQTLFMICNSNVISNGNEICFEIVHGGCLQTQDLTMEHLPILLFFVNNQAIIL